MSTNQTDPLKPGFQSSEALPLAILTLLAGCFTIASTLGLIHVNTQDLTNQIMSLVLPLGTLMAATVAAWKYMQVRTDLKMKHMEVANQQPPLSQSPPTQGVI